MDKSIFSNRKVLLLSTVSIIVVLLVYFVFFSPLSFFNESDEGDVTDWTDYPYVIPGTDMRFPDEEGFYPHGENWISVGFRFDFDDPNMESLYFITLYHEDYKDVALFSSEWSQKNRVPGEQSLPEGKLDMRFNNPGLPDDVFKAKEDGAFQYDFHSFFELEGRGLYEIDLELVSTKPPVTMYDGEVEFGDKYIRYHALTRCTIQGNVIIDQDSYEVTGLAYLENLRGSFRGLNWEWFAFWSDHGEELKIVELHDVAGDSRLYGMYVSKSGNHITIKDLSIEVTSVKNGFGNSFEISSSRYSLFLNITCVEEMTIYNGFAVGFANVRGEMFGREVDTITYIELTKMR